MSRMPLRAASCLALAVFALSGSGCSWAFVQKAPEPVMTPNYPVSCTDSKAAPVLDTIRFRPRVLVSSDRHLARFFKYVREFPRARPRED